MSNQEILKIPENVEQPASNEEIVPVSKSSVRGITTSKLLAMDIKTFRSHLRKGPKYTTLMRYRRDLANQPSEDEERKLLDKKKLLAVEKTLRTMISEGMKVSRRKAGTGTRTEVEHEYKDTIANRKLNRVGQKYKRVVYEDYETEERDAVLRRRKRKRDPDAPKKTNLWIESVQIAKQELNAPKWIVIRKEVKDPDSEDQKLAVKIYNRAMELMRKKKEESTKEISN
jgi:hypothetical protein